MRHKHSVTGKLYSLRPLEDADAQLVVDLRNNEDLAKYLHRGAETVRAQLDWQNAYYARENDYYFAIQANHDDRTEGLIALYDIDDRAKCAEWGRWLLRPGSLAAPESALLIYSFAFDVLDLKRVCCRTVAQNRSVVSFHDSCGLPRTAELPDYFDISGQKLDAIEHSLAQDAWPKVKERLDRIITRLARKQKTS